MTKRWDCAAIVAPGGSCPRPIRSPGGSPIGLGDRSNDHIDRSMVCRHGLTKVLDRFGIGLRDCHLAKCDFECIRLIDCL